MDRGFSIASYRRPRRPSSGSRLPIVWTSQSSSKFAMWPRSQASGLRIGVYCRLSSSSESGATSRRVRARASASRFAIPSLSFSGEAAGDSAAAIGWSEASMPEP